jgi:Leucine-rich repeat (LRR) protein
MEVFRKCGFLIAFMVAILGFSACGGPKGDLFPDPELAEAVWEALGKPTNAIVPSDLETLTSLDASYRGVANLAGLEYCTKLTKLRIEDGTGRISDISPLASMGNLTELRLNRNQVVDISPLASLTKLTVLDLSANPVADVSPLSSLSSLTELHLGDTNHGNPIGDISPVASLTKLTVLDLNRRQIDDISPLASLTNLAKLDLSSNYQMSDISPLASLTNLAELDLSSSQISDLSPLGSLTNLTELNLYGNQISDLSSLASLTKLITLTLDANEISDVSPLASLAGLAHLGLNQNEISDVSPLAALSDLTYLGLGWNQIADASPLLENSGLGRGDWLSLRHGNPLDDESLGTYIPQLRSRGVHIPQVKTSIGIGGGGFILIPIVAFIAALAVVILLPPTRGGRRKGLIRKGLVVGVVLIGMYTLLATLATTFDVVWLEDQVLWVWIPGLLLYGAIAVVVVIGRKRAAPVSGQVRPQPSPPLPEPISFANGPSVRCPKCGHDNASQLRCQCCPRVPGGGATSDTGGLLAPASMGLDHRSHCRCRCRSRHPGESVPERGPTGGSSRA